MSPTVTYSIDSSALIHAWRRAYRPANFPSFWQRMDELIESGRLKASIEVFNELKKKDDDVFQWCKDRKDKFVVELDEATQDLVVALMDKYPRLVDTAKGRSGGDPFVIALAGAHSPQMTVVSEENAGKTRIPDVCDAETIDVLKIVDLIEQEGWVL
jgi:hypothetical protein